MGVKEILLDRRKKEGIEQGIEEGKVKEKREMAIKLKAKNMLADEIAEITGLSVKEIETLE